MRKRYIAIEPIVADEPAWDSDRAIYFADEVDQRIAQLEAERVPDELLIKLISGYRYNEDLQPIIDADAILAKRKG